MTKLASLDGIGPNRDADMVMINTKDSCSITNERCRVGTDDVDHVQSLTSNLFQKENRSCF